MSDYKLNEQAQAVLEPAGIRALREAQRKVVARIEATSRELGDIAAQYGITISNYQKELGQLNEAFATLAKPWGTIGGDVQACGPVPQSCNYKKF